MKYGYGCFYADITYNCNIRCRFCVNDWSQIKGNTNMSIKTFAKLIEVMPFLSNNGFYISCNFEPLIHPHFLELLEMLPVSGRVKCLFTTNLTKRLSDNDIERLSKVNVNHIQISLDSFNPNIFEEFRVGAKFSIFIDNLNRLVEVFKETPNAPKLKYITMIFKQNVNELEDIIKTCNEKYLSTQNQFRTPFSHSLLKNDTQWINDSLITDKQWDSIYENLIKLPYNIKLVHQAKNIVYPSAPKCTPSGINYIDFHIRSNGLVIHRRRSNFLLPPDFQNNFNINDIDNPYEFFNKNRGEV